MNGTVGSAIDAEHLAPPPPNWKDLPCCWAELTRISPGWTGSRLEAPPDLCRPDVPGSHPVRLYSKSALKARRQLALARPLYLPCREKKEVSVTSALAAVTHSDQMRQELEFTVGNLEFCG